MGNISKRTKKPDEVQQVGAETVAWLAGKAEEDTSLQQLQQYRVLPRVKIMQGMTDSDLKARFGGEGVACLPRAGLILCINEALDSEKREPIGLHEFHFVPLFFFVEFCKWRDRRDGNINPVVEKTFDPASELAAKARDPDKREAEIYAGGPEEKPWKYRYVEHLNFAGVIYDNRTEDAHPLAGREIVISFERGDFYQGQNFINAIMTRRVPGTTTVAPCWAQVWKFLVGVHKNRSGNEWWGFDFDNPTDVPLFIEEELGELFEKAYLGLKRDHQANRLAVERDDLDGEDQVRTDIDDETEY